MQNIQKVVIAILLLLFVTACDEEKLTVETIKEEVSSNNQGPGGGNGPVPNQNTSNNYNISGPVYSDNQLVIKYNSGLDEADKIALRDAYEVISYKECQVCFDGELELWTFKRGINLEPRKKSIEDNEDGPDDLGMPKPIVHVNREKSFYTSSVMKSRTMLVSGISDDINHLVEGGAGIAVGVLDSGIDTNFTLFNNESGEPIDFLYNPSHEEAVEGEISGWDFVNEDNEPFDDNPEKHGTAISHIIRKTASKFDTPVRILPLKIADASGKISYFHLLCAFKFAADRVSIINISAGWYDNHVYDNSILKELLDEYANVTVVTSAGNTQFNNDREDIVHLPSSFEHGNIIAVAAAKKNNAGTMWKAASEFSNFGKESVDFFAPGMNIPFYHEDGSVAESIQGTSFAAPFVVGKAAAILQHSDIEPIPEAVKEKLDFLGETAEYELDTKYKKIILPLWLE